MDEVARSAQVSRQGLYLHFATKEDLFREVVRDHFERSRERAQAALADESRPIEDRLLDAFDAWLGPAVGQKDSCRAELIETAQSLFWAMIEHQINSFIATVGAAVEASPPLVQLAGDLGMAPRDVALTLDATAHGFKLLCDTREEFRERMTRAIRLVVRPSDGQPPAASR